jgi:hypothetical protein
MKINEDHLSMVYVLCPFIFFVEFLLNLSQDILPNPVPMTTSTTTIDSRDEDQKYSLARFALIGGAIGYGALFLVSYLHWSLVVVCLIIG